jgi:hypothetical protein
MIVRRSSGRSCSRRPFIGPSCSLPACSNISSGSLIEHHPLGTFVPHLIETFSWGRFIAIQLLRIAKPVRAPQIGPARAP